MIDDMTITTAPEPQAAPIDEFAIGIALLDLEQRALRSIADRGPTVPLDLTDPITATLSICAALIPNADTDGQQTLDEVRAFYTPNRLRTRRIVVDTNALRITLDGFSRAWTRGNSVGVDLLLRRALGTLSAPLART